MVVITDSKTLTISIVQHGFAVIKNLVYPEEVEANESFQIVYDCENTGTVEDTLFGRMKDANGNIIPDSEWQETIAPTMSVTKTKLFAEGITEELTVTIEVGHL